MKKWSVTEFRGQLLVTHPDGAPVLLHVAANGEIGMTRLPMTEAGPAPRVGTNAGHGHVWKRPDGMVARCGGPGMCKECSREAAQLSAHATVE